MFIQLKKKKNLSKLLKSLWQQKPYFNIQVKKKIGGKSKLIIKRWN